MSNQDSSPQAGLPAGGQGKPTQLQIELDEATTHGIYINLAMIGHTETEFTMDFNLYSTATTQRQGPVPDHLQPQPYQAISWGLAGQHQEIRSEIRNHQGGAGTGEEGGLLPIGPLS